MTGQTRPMADVDELARRTTTLIAGLARKGMSLATGVVVVVLVIGGLSYLTGLAALEGSARSAWTVVGLGDARSSPSVPRCWPAGGCQR